MKKKQWAVFIGRFSPFHNGHSKVLAAALNNAENVIIVIGSADEPTNPKNPWTVDERQEMISCTLSPEQKERVFFAHSPDYYNNPLWLADVQYSVAEITNYAEDKDIGLVYCPTDHSSNYLEDFPQWKDSSLSFSFNEPCHATDIRNLYFTMDVAFRANVHPNVAEYLNVFWHSDSFKSTKAEFDYYREYKEMQRGAPWPIIFSTTDACVIRSGHILLVKRKAYPGRGLWALPGGFLGYNERIEDSMLRELKEETSIAMPKSELRAAIIESKVIDEPGRSLRGRTITHAYLIDLGRGALPRVKGSDDAERAKWFTVDVVMGMRKLLFEDHHAIISYFVNRIKQ